MADDPVNQQQFLDDVAAMAGSGDAAASYSNVGQPGGDFKMPSVDEVWKLIEGMEGISDEERASIRESLYNPQEGTAEDFLKRLASQQPAMGPSSGDYITFFAMLAIIALIFALFGYKLYKSLKEKELKKQEKLKSKQGKKSKKSN